MRIVLAVGGEQHDVALSVNHERATVANFIRACQLSPRRVAVAVDGEVLDAEQPLLSAGIVEGSVVTLISAGTQPDPPEDPADDVAAPPGDTHLAITEGPRAGVRFRLTGEEVVIGREGGRSDITVDDATLSRRHVQLRRDASGWIAEDLGSRNGTWVDGARLEAPQRLRHGSEIGVGASKFVLQPPGPEDESDRAVLTSEDDGTLRFTRTARPDEAAAPQPPRPPLVPDAPPTTTLQILALLIVPVVFGGGLAFGFGQPLLGVVALAGPLLALVALRRTTEARSAHAAEVDAFDDELEAYDDELGQVAASERARRQQRSPDVREMLRRIRLPSRRLWERRRSDEDVLRLRVGTATMPSGIDLTVDGEEGDPGCHARLDAVLARRRTLPDAPVEIDLRDGRTVGIVGDRPATLAAARALLIHAAGHHGPADLTIAVVANSVSVEGWDWAKWLPHTRVDGAHLLASTPREVDEVLHALWTGSSPDGPQQLLVVDHAPLLADRNPEVLKLLRGDAGEVSGIVLAAEEEELPAATTAILTVAEERADVWWPRSGTRIDDLVADQVAEPTARRAARQLSRYRDPDQPVAEADLPDRVGLITLLGLGYSSPEVLASTWQREQPDPGLTVPLGVGPAGRVSVDLDADGPHTLLAGEADTDRSGLLLALTAGLATRADPAHLNFLFVDATGTGTFSLAAGLPHTAALVDDLDGVMAMRLLRALQTEVRRRAEVLRAAKVTDVAGYTAGGAPTGPLPRLLVVVDELAALLATDPALAQGLASLAGQSRDVGVHLLAAAAGPDRLPDLSVQEVFGLRVALRSSAAGSQALLGSEEAAAFTFGQTGRVGFVRRAAGQTDPGPIEFAETPAGQTAPSGIPAPVDLMRFPFSATPPTPPPPEAPADGYSDLERIVAACAQAAALSGSPTPRSVWTPLLPDHVGLEQLAAEHPGSQQRRESTPGRVRSRTAAGSRRTTAGEDAAAAKDTPAGEDTTVGGERTTAGGDAPAGPGVFLGVLDDVDGQRQAPLRWYPSRGHLLVSGRPGTGTTTTLRAAALALASALPHTRCHLYALDTGSGLAPLADLPHCAEVVATSDTRRRARLLRLLRSELDRRRDLPEDELEREPLIALVIDGFGSLHSQLEHHVTARQAAADLQRLFTGGPAVRMVSAVSLDSPADLPDRLAQSVGLSVVLPLADVADYPRVGIDPRTLPEPHPGRAVLAGSGTPLQLTDASDDGKVGKAIAELAAAAPSGPRHRPLTLLPEQLRAGEIADRSAVEPDGAVTLTVGIDEQQHDPVGLRLAPGGGALIVGPDGSGVTTALVLIAERLRSVEDTYLVAIAGPDSPLPAVEGLFATLAGPDDLADLLEALRQVGETQPGRRRALLVDGADLVTDDQGNLAALLTGNGEPSGGGQSTGDVQTTGDGAGAGAAGEARVRQAGPLHVVAGVTPQGLTAAGAEHWTQALAEAGTGVLLTPQSPGDGAALGVRLPANPPVAMPAGRGYLTADGAATLLQLCLPDPDRPG